MKAGDTFLTPSGAETGKHLWFVASDPKKGSEQVLIVNITGVKGHAKDDPTCIVEPGDHPYVAKRSYICYEGGRLVPLAFLEEQIASKSFTPHTPADPSLIRRIQQGVIDAPDAPIEQRALMRKQGLPHPPSK